MNYTVISRSGYQGDHWRVKKEFSSKPAADAYAQSIASPDAKSNSYNVRVMAHRKPIAKLTDFGNLTVKFSDGTIATYSDL